ncbi:hypothetical protein J2T20_004944 [Paenibacillus wynnii]|nr:hypothetical protein [Paenibacillus wynnii]
MKLDRELAASKEGAGLIVIAMSGTLHIYAS